MRSESRTHCILGDYAVVRSTRPFIVALSSTVLAAGLAAFAGLIGPPMLIAIVLAALYARFGEIETLRRILAGIACAAVGLLIAVVLRMMTPLVRKRDVAGMLMLIAVFVAIGVLRLPLQVVLLVAVPLSLFITWFLHTRATT